LGLELELGWGLGDKLGLVGIARRVLLKRGGFFAGGEVCGSLTWRALVGR